MKPSLPALPAGAFASIAVALQLSLAPGLGAQEEPPPTPEELLLEQAWMESLEANGPSHASGGRPELGPVVLGNPTGAVVVLRVGLYYPSFNAAGGVVSEFSTLNHPFVDVSGTVDTVHVIDRATGHQIVAMDPGVIIRVQHDGSGFQVWQ